MLAIFIHRANRWGGEWKKWAIPRNVICIFKVEFPKTELVAVLITGHFKRLLGGCGESNSTLMWFGQAT